MDNQDLNAHYVVKYTLLTVYHFCVPPLENTSAMPFIKACNLFMHLLRSLFAKTEIPYSLHPSKLVSGVQSAFSGKYQ